MSVHSSWADRFRLAPEAEATPIARAAWTRVIALGLLGLLLAADAYAEDSSGRLAAPRVDAVFVIDNSGSMKTSDPKFVTRQVMLDFAAQLGRGSRLGVVLFDSEARLVEPLSRAVGPDTADRWAEVLSQVDYRGQLTNSPAGIERALYEFRLHGREGVENLIVFITDGIVDTGDPRIDVEKKRWLTEDLADESRRAGVRIFGIALTESADVELIQALALRTDGEYFRVLEARDIGAALGRISLQLASAPVVRSVADAPGTAVGPATVAHTPPVSSAPSTRTRGAILLSLGVLVAAAALLVPAVQRRRRMRAPRVTSPSMPRIEVPAAPRSGRSTGRQPIASLIDVSKVSSRGLLPFSIDRRRISVGRDRSNDISIPRETISSFHATIDYKDGYFYVEDHRSTNGTSVNGRTLEPHEPMQLKSGDQIEFSSFEFRFIIPDREPRGRTLVLDGTSLPGVGRAEGAASGLEGAREGSGEITSYPDAFSECLRVHLEKIEGLGAAHADFVAQSFPTLFVEVLRARAQELIERCGETGEGQVLDLSKSGIHYTLCVLPEQMDAAADWFGRERGGYAKFLAGLLDEWASGSRECRAICVVTFGMVEAAWISITVVPARRDAEGDEIEIMSFEFLNEDERRRAASFDIVEVSRGL